MSMSMKICVNIDLTEEIGKLFFGYKIVASGNAFRDLQSNFLQCDLVDRITKAHAVT